MIMLFVIAGIDAVILSALVAILNEDEIDMTTAFIISLVAAIGTVIVSVVLFLFIGIIGLVAGLLLSTAAVGYAVNVIFDVPGKRAFLIGTLFMIAHGAMSVGFSMFTASDSDPTRRESNTIFHQETQVIE